MSIDLRVEDDEIAALRIALVTLMHDDSTPGSVYQNQWRAAAVRLFDRINGLTPDE